MEVLPDREVLKSRPVSLRADRFDGIPQLGELNPYANPAVNYGDAAVSWSRHDEIFKNLVSTFDTADQLQKAETMIDHLIDEITFSTV